MTVEPPPLATWLLTNLICGRNCESLVGDLVERYQQKRSALWYWHQTVIAIVASFAAEAWCHRWIAMVVIAVDLLLPNAYVHFLSHSVNVVYGAWYPRLIDWLARTAPDVIWSIAIFLHPWAWTGTVAWCALLGSIAWILVRVRPRQRGLILSIFVLSNISQCMPYLCDGLMGWLHDVGNPVPMFGFLWYATFVFVATPLSILIGGGYFTAPRPLRPMANVADER